MALDTRNKRASALGIAVATFALVVPNPDGLLLDQGDRQQTAFCYRGILASPLTVLYICDTSVISLQHAHAVGSLQSVRDVVSLQSERTVERACP